MHHLESWHTSWTRTSPIHGFKRQQYILVHAEGLVPVSKIIKVKKHTAGRDLFATSLKKRYFSQLKKKKEKHYRCTNLLITESKRK